MEIPFDHSVIIQLNCQFKSYFILIPQFFDKFCEFVNFSIFAVKLVIQRVWLVELLVANGNVLL